MKGLYFQLLAILLIISPKAGAGQNIVNDLRKINEAFAGQKEASIKAAYILYSSHTSSEVVDKQKAVIKRSGKSYYHKLGQIENITNSKVTLAIDHINKVITVSNPKLATASTLFPISLDSLKSYITGSKYTEPVQGVGSYTFDLPSTTFEKASIKFDRSNYKLQSLILYYKAIAHTENGVKVKPRLEIQLTYDLTAIQQAVFSETKYIRWEGNKITLQPAYSTYRIINQISTAKK